MSAAGEQKDTRGQSAPLVAYRKTLDEDWCAHLHEKGFVVIAGALSPTELQSARNLLTSDIERIWPGSCEDPEKLTLQEHGLQAELAQSAGAWAVRGAPGIRSAYSKVWDGESDLITSLDAVIVWKRWGEGFADSKPVVEGLHLDQNPFQKPNLETVQGMVPLYDVTPTVGGLAFVPGSHKTEELERMKERNPQFDGKGDWCELPVGDAYYGTQELAECEAGDLILWDSRCVHGGYVGTGPAEDTPIDEKWGSTLCRLSVLVGMSARSRATPEVLAARRLAYETNGCHNHTPHEGGTSSGTIKAETEDNTYTPCPLSPEMWRLLDGSDGSI